MPGRVTALMLCLLAGPGCVRDLAAQVSTQLEFPLRDLLPRAYEAAGGSRRWAGARDISMLQVRSQLRDDGSLRAAEEIELYVQNVPAVSLLMIRRGPRTVIHQGWRAESHWMVQDGLRVHDKFRLEAARRELLESLWLDRLPFSLTEAVTGRLAFEGVFDLGGRPVRRVRYESGEFPGGPVWLLFDAARHGLRGVGYFDRPAAAAAVTARSGTSEPSAESYVEIGFRRPTEEHGITLPWVREFRQGGKLVRRDEVKRMVCNQWFSPDVFRPEAWLKRGGRGPSDPRPAH